jgi:hypothetical protein
MHKRGPLPKGKQATRGRPLLLSGAKRLAAKPSSALS